MPSSRKLPNVLRAEPEADTHPVSRLELFFDLVFVFAATQLSHALLDDLTLLGGIHALILLLAVWWIWIHTTWMTNVLDPETAPVRIVLVILMGIGLVLSSTIPYAFAERGLAFAACYVAIQLGRTAFTWWALRAHEPAEARH